MTVYCELEKCTNNFDGYCLLDDIYLVESFARAQCEDYDIKKPKVIFPKRKARAGESKQ